MVCLNVYYITDYAVLLLKCLLYLLCFSKLMIRFTAKRYKIIQFNNMICSAYNMQIKLILIETS